MTKPYYEGKKGKVGADGLYDFFKCPKKQRGHGNVRLQEAKDT